MGESASNNYVAELLKQLEELKRKKARKERKLMKLKSSSPQNTKKIKALNESATSSIANFDSKIQVTEVEKDSNTISVGIKNYNSIDKEEEINPIICPESFKHRCSYKNDRNNLFCEQLCPNTETKCINSKKAISAADTRTENDATSADSVFYPQFVKKKKDGILSKAKSSSNKSSASGSGKSKSPDLLDDAFNRDTSYFMSSYVLAACDDKEEKIQSGCNTICNQTDKIEHSKQAEMGAELISSDFKISPPFTLNPSPNDSQKTSFDVFNFPKFSTPTDMNTYLGGVRNIINDSPDRPETVVSDKFCNSDSKMKTLASENIHKNDDIKKFDSTRLNGILRKGLSSVLDAYYGSPTKESVSKCANINKVNDNTENYDVQDSTKYASKKRKLSSSSSEAHFQQKPEMFDNSNTHTVSECNIFDAVKIIVPDQKLKVEIRNNLPCELKGQMIESCDKFVNDLDFDNSILYSDPFTDSQDVPSAVAPVSPKNISSHNNSSSNNKISSQVAEAVHGLIAEVCEHVSNHSPPPVIIDGNLNDNIAFDSEILIIPETEGLGPFFFNKDTEDFLETSTLSQSFKPNGNLLNASLQSRLECPAVNHTMPDHSDKSSYKGDRLNESENEIQNELLTTSKQKRAAVGDGSSTSYMPCDSLALDTPFLEEDTQELGKLKQIPYMSEENVQGDSVASEFKPKTESNLSFTCTLQGAAHELVKDAEIIIFNDIKYAFLQHMTQIHVWRQEKMKWIKIFYHTIEDMHSLDNMCISKDADNLVIIMLLRIDQRSCLQFLLFEKGARVIKLMENTHWLEERHSTDPVLLCGLEGLMFATAQCNEVSLHAFISLKENPRLMTAILGSTDATLCSLCKIDKLPNALMGVNDSMLYIWHILEARLVTAVSLQPHDYLPIKTCFWATVEKGLIYFMTICAGAKDFQVCQLLAANLATGFCQSAMTYTTLPSETRSRVLKITKATYLEPFLVIAHSHGAFLWSVTDEFCCASLSSKSQVTTVTACKDIENWGLIAVGGNSGCLHCYSLNC